MIEPDVNRTKVAILCSTQKGATMTCSRSRAKDMIALIPHQKIVVKSLFSFVKSSLVPFNKRSLNVGQGCKLL